MYKNLKEIVIIQIKSELTIFVNLWIFKEWRVWNNETFSTVFRVRSLVFVQNIILLLIKNVGEIFGFVNYRL